MKGATCFSGIGAPECAAPWIDWRWSAEIEPFPAAVHAHHFPAAVNLGDVLAPGFLARASAEPIDILVGGPPCQAFSIAGLRHSLADARGNLTLRWVQVIHAVRPGYAVTENVPGWLSTKDNAFGCFLAGLVGADDPLRTPDGGSWPDAGMAAGPLGRAAWRVLDAQHFGVPQRRRRVFAVFCPPDGGDPAAILFERQGVRRHPSPGREAREDVAPTVGSGPPYSRTGNSRVEADAAVVADTVRSHPRPGGNSVGLIAFAQNSRSEVRAIGGDGQIVGAISADPGAQQQTYLAYGGNNQAGPIDVATARNAHGGPHGRPDFESETFVVQPTAYRVTGNDGAYSTGDQIGALGTGTDPSSHVLAFQCHGSNVGEMGTLRRGNGNTGGGVPFIPSDGVRRLLPVETERLQGLPDGWTDIALRGKPAADGSRYKAIGNSMAVPVISWVLQRLLAADEVIAKQ